MSRPYRGMRPLTDTEIVDIVSYLKENRRFSTRDIVLFTMQHKLGFRIKEMLSLRIKDVYPHAPAVGDQITIQRRYMKGGRRRQTNTISRTVPVPPSCVDILEDYYLTLKEGGYGGDDPMFPSSVTDKALRTDSCCRMFKKMADALKMTRVGTHSCRKTFAKRIYNACDKDIMETKAALGHSNVATTQQYLSYNLGEAFKKAMSES